MLGLIRFFRNLGSVAVSPYLLLLSVLSVPSGIFLFARKTVAVSGGSPLFYRKRHKINLAVSHDLHTDKARIGKQAPAGVTR